MAMIEYHGPSDTLAELFDEADVTDEFIRFLSVRFDVGTVFDSDDREYVQVVRCKDCDNLLKGNFNNRCFLTYGITELDDYCSYGVRA